MIIRFKSWLILPIASLVIGSSIAISEELFTRTIDYLLPDANKVKTFSRPGTITLLSTNKEIIQKLGPATREKVKSGKMPLLVKNAFIAAEDRRFYYHNGVDLWGVSRAIFRNLIERSVREGASTITQQLARTVFLSQDKTLTRKLKEAALALKLERQLNKEQILEQYLNNVYLGSGAYGIADASWVYFSKTPNLLTLEEVALIAGLPPAPSIFSPLVNPNLAIRQRSIVLQRMRKEGFISEEELLSALKSPLDLNPSAPKYFNSKAPFFTSWVAKIIPKLLSREQLEIGGLQIRTSLNMKWQKNAKEIIQTYTPEYLEGALVAIQPKTGLIRVLVGGKDFSNTQFNRATQALRSPGSTFKLFPYAAAINKGIKPEEKFQDEPTCWYGYCPKNFGNKYMGQVSMADALKYSLNSVAVKILDKIGFEEVINTANKFGIGNQQPLGKYLPLAIGAYEQTVLDMTAAYAGVTNRGIFMQPSPVEEILGPDGNLLWSQADNGVQGVRAIKEQSADTLNWMLKGVVEDGTGIAASLKGREVIGKTGTSEGARDLWFIGSIPQLTTGVWLGRDDNKTTSFSSGEAAFIWKQFMLKIETDFKKLSFTSR